MFFVRRYFFYSLDIVITTGLRISCVLSPSLTCIGADGMIYVGSYNHYLYVFQNNGRVLWKFKTQKFVFSSPAICSDGLLLVSSDDGTLYALRTESKGLVNSPWPKFRANTTNSGSNLTLRQNR